jgi:dTDP-4-amino-4,6-dideoxygalactose transaminase
LKRNQKIREKLVKVYREELQGVEGVSVPFCQFEGNPSYHLFPVLVEADRRNRLMEELREDRIQTSVHFPPVHLFSLYRREFGFRKGMLPKTEEVGLREVSLPLHPRMSGRDAKWIAKKVKGILLKSNNGSME